MAKPRIPSAAELTAIAEAFTYDPLTGELRWRHGNRARNPAAKRGPGELAGAVCPSSGYWRVGINGRQYLNHLVIWFLMTGLWPTEELDHKNVQKANNRWSNLRPATHPQNGANRPVQRNNATGFKGVYPHKDRFKAGIRVDGVKHYLGCFDTAEEAGAAYAAAAQQLHREFARFN